MTTQVNTDGLFLDRHYAGVGINRYLVNLLREMERFTRNAEGFRTVSVRGVVPETVPCAKAAKVCCLSIDMTCAAPEMAAAECFWDKLVSGAVIVLDDYGWKLHFEQFGRSAAQKGVRGLALPTSQGLIFKS